MCSRHANVLQEFEHTKPLSPNPHFQRVIGDCLGHHERHIRPAAKHETYYVSRFHYWRAISKKKTNVNRLKGKLPLVSPTGVAFQKRPVQDDGEATWDTKGRIPTMCIIRAQETRFRVRIMLPEVITYPPFVQLNFPSGAHLSCIRSSFPCQSQTLTAM